MTPFSANPLSRRFFLQDLALGLGGIALGSLMQTGAHGNVSEIGANAARGGVLPHFAPRAKHVVFLFMAGGPSQLDLFDPKPALAKYEGQRVPEEVLKGAELPFIERDASLMPSPFKFARHGQSGAQLSELFRRYQRGGRVELHYRTVAVCWRLAEARSTSLAPGEAR